VSEDWLSGDPFADSNDPAAQEREQRRREREERRRQRAEKEGKATPAALPSAEPTAPPPAEPPPRTPEQEFWDEQPAEPVPPPAPVATAPDFHDDGHPEMAGAARRGRRFGDGGGNRGRGILGAIARHPFRVFGVIALIFAAWFLIELFQPFHPAGSGRV
jgi:hypothetical protein